MKVVIPMAGKGERFKQYFVPKPLIEVDSRYMIEYIIDCFPIDTEFIFICFEEHLLDTGMKRVLMELRSNAIIVSVKDTKGPAHTASNALEYIGDDEQVFVSYCDFIQIWNYRDFLDNVREKNADGAIMNFIGFHPAFLQETLYAYSKVKDGFVTKIQEKERFSDDKMGDYASTGMFYYRSGKIFKDYIQRLVSNDDLRINGEYYISTSFSMMIEDKLKIMNHEIGEFICLGTPRDYELYRFWSDFFRRYLSSSHKYDIQKKMVFQIDEMVPVAFTASGNEFLYWQNYFDRCLVHPYQK